MTGLNGSNPLLVRCFERSWEG